MPPLLPVTNLSGNNFAQWGGGEGSEPHRRDHRVHMEAALPGDGDSENGQTGHQGRSLPEVPGSLELGGIGSDSLPT